MDRLIIIIILFSSLNAFADEPTEIELAKIDRLLRAAEQKARCMEGIYRNFDSKEEQIVYSKFYKELVKDHKQFIEFSLKYEESDMLTILKYVGSIDILVGMVMQGTLIRAQEYNERYENERAGKSLSEFNRFLWEVNSCDAIYSKM